MTDAGLTYWSHGFALIACGALQNFWLEIEIYM